MCMHVRERWLSTHGESDFLHMMWAHPRQDKTRRDTQGKQEGGEDEMAA